ncbi:mechanosensitive ion channel domain-containing protein [Bermanella sp. WJH001]|uniref:mechanosensitive ion channel family protein n=1 Tax=Bermanella sp. WJH001 TaxID=3048005 RepID=UPI0024BEDD38|nr:mechanosensitive ion channel family protein [Bermanella sp. WJH001]MDJ1537616.1 mechanosensitive ion channel family protein [Bermanella sp. WJH001]
MLNILIGIGFVLSFVVLSNAIENWIERHGRRRNVSNERIFYIQKIIKLVGFLLLLIVAAAVFGFNYSEFSFIVSSVFAVVGVALFAQWSILSNVTASIIIFFFFPYRVGDKVRITDEKEHLEGDIIEITLFHLILRRECGDILTYPNSLVFQKAIIIHPKTKNAPVKEIEPNYEP